MVAESLNERDDLPVMMNWHGDAQVGQVADAAFRLIHVIVEEDVARLDGLDRKIAHDRLHQGRVGTAGQLAAMTIVDATAKVARFADHRRAGGALDGRFDFGLGRSQCAFDDFDDDGVEVSGGRRVVAWSTGHRVRSRSRLPYVSTRSVC